MVRRICSVGLIVLWLVGLGSAQELEDEPNGTHPSVFCASENLSINSIGRDKFPFDIQSINFDSGSDGSSMTLRLHNGTGDSIVEAVLLVGLMDEQGTEVLLFPVFYSDDQFRLRRRSTRDPEWVPKSIYQRRIGSMFFLMDDRSFGANVSKRLPGLIRTVTTYCPKSAQVRYVGLEYASGGKFEWSDGEWRLAPTLRIASSSEALPDFKFEPEAAQQTFLVRASVDSRGCASGLSTADLSVAAKRGASQILRSLRFHPSSGGESEFVNVLLYFRTEEQPKYDWHFDRSSLPKTFEVVEIVSAKQGTALLSGNEAVALSTDDTCTGDN